MKTMSLLVILSSLSAASLTAHAGGDPVAGKTIAESDVADECDAFSTVHASDDNRPMRFVRNPLPALTT